MNEDSARQRWPPGRLAQNAGQAALALLLAYFAARLAYFALQIAPGVPPDEATHMGRLLAFAQVWGLPAPGPDNFQHGLLVDSPFLYSWLMGKLLALNFTGASDLIFLRLANAALGLLTVGYGLRWIRLLTSDRAIHLVFVLLLTNTMMFTGISATVSYDNLANWLGAACVFHLFRFFQRGNPRDLVALAGFAAAGCLTKSAFLPLAAILAAVLLLRERERLPALLRSLFEKGRDNGRPVSLGVVVAAALILANLLLYGGNLVRYQKLVPGFEQVVGVEAARQSRIFARDHALSGFRSGRLSYAEALAAIEQIPHAGDRRTTSEQLAQTRWRGERRYRPLHYVWLWSRIMLDRSVGYFGHRALKRSPPALIAYAAVLGLAIVLHFGVWPAAERRLATLAGAIALAYALILLALVNYPTYRETGLVDAGVQGRYLFPVLIPLLGFVAHALAAPRLRALRWPLWIAVGGLFLLGDFPVFVQGTSPAWFGQ